MDITCNQCCWWVAMPTPEMGDSFGVCTKDTAITTFEYSCGDALLKLTEEPNAVHDTYHQGYADGRYATLIEMRRLFSTGGEQ